MLWKRHHSIYNPSTQKNNLIIEHSNKQTPKNRNPLIPIMSSPVQESIQPGQNPKFLIRKPTKSKQAKSSISGTFFMHRGNNHQIVKQALEQLGFVESLVKQQCCLIWYQGKDLAKRDFMKNEFNPRATNYLPNHAQITNKQKLFENISKFDPSCVGSYVPRTYIVDFKDNLTKIQNNLTQFLAQFFRKAGITRTTKRNTSSLCITNYYGEMCVPYAKAFKFIHEMKKPQIMPEINSNSTIVASSQKKPLWIVKPSFLNRGQGIQVISSLKQLEKILSEDNQQISMRMYQPEEKNVPSCFVIQEYIMDPLLYLGYKFDIRVWILLKSTKNNGLQVYIYKKSYVRLAGHKYTNQQCTKQQQFKTINEDQNQKKVILTKSIQLSPSQKNQRGSKNSEISDKFVHLTNNAVQKNCKQYGSLYEGNQMLVSQLCNKLALPKLTEAYLYQNFTKITRTLIESSKQKLNCKASYGSFQLIGLDFMIDSKLNIWLIEANCNPCLQESSSILKQIIPKMLKQLLYIVNINKIMGVKDDRSESREDYATHKANTDWEKII